MTKKEGDAICEAVLAVVASLVEVVKKANELDPTGCGHVADEMRHFVQNRSE